MSTAMNRRFFVVGAGTGLLAGQSLAGKTPIGPTGPAGTPMRAWVERPTPVKQECPSWCWAASAAMIFGMNGHPIDQKSIIQRALNAVPCTTAPPLLISKILSTNWIDSNGIEFRSKLFAAYDYMNGIVAMDNSIIINELENNKPLLYANKHHAMVVVSVDYLETPMGPNVVAVGVLDPLPGAPDYHLLSYKEMMAAHIGGDYSYLAAVHIEGM